MTNKLHLISPLDGRYSQISDSLKSYFSEYAYLKYRVKIEVEYLKMFAKILKISSGDDDKKLNSIVKNFSIKDAEVIKVVEDKVRHDIKAIEYFLREKINKLGLKKLSAYIHIGLTSEDINNLAYSLMLQDSFKFVISQELVNLIKQIKSLLKQYQRAPILARTHGQPAVMTTFGKEMANYYYRLEKQIARLNSFKFEGKLNGAVGNYNALQLVYPKIDWVKFSEKLITYLGLAPNYFTTQILYPDRWIEYFQILSLINNILVNLSQDIWNYIMLETLILKKEKNQVGSSTMPQKVNPIDFENAEGNLQIANCYFELYSRKLIISRLQRDLSDSTVKRTFGVALGHMILAWKNIVRGFKKISLDEVKTKQELDNHWEILAEGLQTYLRSIGDDHGYEKLKKLTQGKKIDRKSYKQIIKELKIKDKRLIELTPEKYIGLASKLVNKLT